MSVQKRCASEKQGGVGKFLCAGMAVFIALCLFLLTGCVNEHNIRLVISQATGIEIPEEARVLYHYCDTTFHPGRHENYTVFEFEKEPVDWLKENNFSTEKDTSYEEDFLNVGFGLLDRHFSENIPKEYIPDFENQYEWLEINRTYFAYFTEQLRLIVFVKPS